MVLQLASNVVTVSHITVLLMLQLLGLLKKRESLMALVAAGWRSLGQSHGRVSITFAQPLSLKQELAAARAATAAAGAAGECAAVVAAVVMMLACAFHAHAHTELHTQLHATTAAVALTPYEYCDVEQAHAST
jgi:glycerol-3-phosphate O-acyltransferase